MKNVVVFITFAVSLVVGPILVVISAIVISYLLGIDLLRNNPGAKLLFGGLAFAMLTAFLVDSRLNRPKPPKGICRSCGYDLRASKKRCPECGTPIAPEPR